LEELWHRKHQVNLSRSLLTGCKARRARALRIGVIVVDGFSSKKRNEVIEWLKGVHNFNHMQASLLAGIHANGGKPVYQSTDGLLDAQFGKNEDMRPLV
jgi:hypothetical protein